MRNSAPTYGSLMRPLNVAALPLSEEERADPLIQRFIELADATSRAEKISNPNDWTPAERAAYDAGDTVGFSRLRGYTEAEITQFLEFIQLVHAVDEKYGEDAAISLHHLINQQTKPQPSYSL